MRTNFPSEDKLTVFLSLQCCRYPPPRCCYASPMTWSWAHGVAFEETVYLYLAAPCRRRSVDRRVLLLVLMMASLSRVSIYRMAVPRHSIRGRTPIRTFDASDLTNLSGVLIISTLVYTLDINRIHLIYVH